MNRFIGMMPSGEIEKEEKFKVGFGQLIVTIQAGKNGWTILYADGSSEYKDEIKTTEDNFKNAMDILKSNFDDINKVN